MEQKKIAIWAGVVLAAGAAIGLGLRFYRSSRAAAARAALDSAMNLPGAQTASPWTIEQGEEMLRQGGLSSSPGFGEWLKQENILRRVIAAVDCVAAGNSPRDSLNFLRPKKQFALRKRRGKLYMGARSYGRYDLTADVFASLNAEKAAQLFVLLKPLFQDAYRELGYANRDFQATSVQAIKVLLDTPLVQGDVLLGEKSVSYELADPKLEQLSPAQKHLLRMGPRNAAKVQAKLRELALALGVPGQELPNSRTYYQN